MSADFFIADALDGERISSGLIIALGFSTCCSEKSEALEGERARSGVEGFELLVFVSCRDGLDGERLSGGPGILEAFVDLMLAARAREA